MIEIRTQRLMADDRALANSLFAIMAEVFGEAYKPLDEAYLDRLLSREDFWAIAALMGDVILGGLTAHTVPMTRAESSEIFIYDIAVQGDHQRRGIGRQLMTALLEGGAAANIYTVFVAADNDDDHALDFYRSLGGIESPVTLFTFSDPRA